jgi:uncharacterized Fe-S cluster protein YjdI
MSDKTHTYTNGEVTIVWKASLCTHSRKCWTGLPEVFKPGERPWIHPDGATTERILAQVKQCPSGALSFQLDNAPEEVGAPQPPGATVEVTPDGPLIVRGTVEVRHADGRVERKERQCALCRCGASANKPFCDGSHRRTGFTG